MSEEVPAAKRQKSILGAPSPTTPTPPAMYDAVVDICLESDTLLVVNSIANIARPVALRVSSHILSLTSPVLKRLLHESASTDTLSATTLLLPTDDGDALLLLCNALHLRNEALPLRISPELLLKYCALAAKYQCGAAASRAAGCWFDHILHKRRDAPLMGVIEAAFVLDDPVWFARFTTMWVRDTPLGVVREGDFGEKRLEKELSGRQKEGINALKVDLDLMVDKLAEALTSDAQHYVECAPGDDPDGNGDGEGDNEPALCTVDKDNATLILAALRDPSVWPATRWPNEISAIVHSVQVFKLPTYDSSEQCTFCFGVEDSFVKIWELVKGMHKDRLWGLCLDCYKAGGVYVGECRVDHIKLEKAFQMTVAKGAVSGIVGQEQVEAGKP